MFEYININKGMAVPVTSRRIQVMEPHTLLSITKYQEWLSTKGVVVVFVIVSVVRVMCDIAVS